MLLLQTTPVATNVATSNSLTVSEVVAIVGLVVAVVGIALSAYAIRITVQRNREIDHRDLAGKIDTAEQRLDILESKSVDRGDIYIRLEDHTGRLLVLETKMSLFYGGVEDIIPKMLQGKFNPIELQPKEKEAYNMWVERKGKTPTTQLRMLENALDRELHIRKDIPADEALNAFFVLQAVKAQLVDRHEHVVRSAYE